MINIGIIGYGYWGPQVVRNFHSLNDARVVVVCDKRAESLKRAKQALSDVEVTTDICQVLTSPDVDAVDPPAGNVGDPVVVNMDHAAVVRTIREFFRDLLADE